MKPGDREYFNRLLEELLEFEEKHEIFWLTREERHEFQAYVKWLTEFAKLPPHGRLIDADAYLETLLDKANECVKKGVGIEAFRSFIEGAEVAFIDSMTMLNNMPTIIEAEE